MPSALLPCTGRSHGGRHGDGPYGYGARPGVRKGPVFPRRGFRSVRRHGHDGRGHLGRRHLAGGRLRSHSISRIDRFRDDGPLLGRAQLLPIEGLRPSDHPRPCRCRSDGLPDEGFPAHGGLPREDRLRPAHQDDVRGQRQDSLGTRRGHRGRGADGIPLPDVHGGVLP